MSRKRCVSKMKRGVLKPLRLYYQQLFSYQVLCHCRHCSKHLTHALFSLMESDGLGTNSSSTMPNHSFSGVSCPHALKG